MYLAEHALEMLKSARYWFSQLTLIQALGLLNLSEGEKQPGLDPGRTVGMALSSAPGTNCVDGCVFELCPYPPKGMQPRGEMSEAFCRRQQSLMKPGPREPGKRKAPWQQMRAAELGQFWVDMAGRARGPGPRSAAADRGDRRPGSG